MSSNYPKIFLAMDNCIFYKRWTAPEEWAEKMAQLGIYNIEASADTELDPLFMGKEYLEDWLKSVEIAQCSGGVRVCNLYSGHGTYSTLGMAHDDERVRNHMIQDWFFPMVEMAGYLGCGLGFFAHAFKHTILQDRDEYFRYVEILTEGLVRINEHAAKFKCGDLGIEQMYTPHQFPWRLEDTEYLLREVSRRSRRNFYFTEDVGHHSRNFFRPSEYEARCWLGSDAAFALGDSKGQDAWTEIEKDMDMHPHLFSEETDADCYVALSKLGCYSPIIHLQQTNGNRSVHEAFTLENNRAGIIEPAKILKAIKDSYDRPVTEGMPDRCSEIYLTLELFSGTTSNMHNVLQDAKTSVDYWRNFIPKDGVALDELI